jgi:hypothetical protein
MYVCKAYAVDSTLKLSVPIADRRRLIKRRESDRSYVVKRYRGAEKSHYLL